MTDRTRRNLEIASLGIFSIIFGAGAGYGSVQAKLASTEARFTDIDTHLTAIDHRLQDIYCATVPTEKRAGCR